MRGQLTLATAIIATIGTVVVGALTAWATSNANIAEVKQQVSIVEEREENHYQEIQKTLIRIEKKLDERNEKISATK